MLPRPNRIPKKLFPSVSAGRVFSNNTFSLRLSKIKGSTEQFKASVVVSKKVAKTAVKRNLLRRRVYAVLLSEKSKIPKGSMIVFYAKSGSANLSFAEIKQAVTELLKTALV